MENRNLHINNGKAGSALFLYLGYLLWKKEKIDIIHAYHHTKVKEKDKKGLYRNHGESDDHDRDRTGKLPG